MVIVGRYRDVKHVIEEQVSLRRQSQQEEAARIEELQKRLEAVVSARLIGLQTMPTAKPLNQCLLAGEEDVSMAAELSQAGGGPQKPNNCVHTNINTLQALQSMCTPHVDQLIDLPVSIW